MTLRINGLGSIQQGCMQSNHSPRELNLNRSLLPSFLQANLPQLSRRTRRCRILPTTCCRVLRNSFRRSSRKKKNSPPLTLRKSRPITLRNPLRWPLRSSLRKTQGNWMPLYTVHTIQNDECIRDGIGKLEVSRCRRFSASHGNELFRDHVGKLETIRCGQISADHPDELFGGRIGKFETIRCRQISAHYLDGLFGDRSSLYPLACHNLFCHTMFLPFEASTLMTIWPQDPRISSTPALSICKTSGGQLIRNISTKLRVQLLGGDSWACSSGSASTKRHTQKLYWKNTETWFPRGSARHQETQNTSSNPPPQALILVTLSMLFGQKGGRTFWVLCYGYLLVPAQI